MAKRAVIVGLLAVILVAVIVALAARAPFGAFLLSSIAGAFVALSAVWLVRTPHTLHRLPSILQTSQHAMGVQFVMRGCLLALLRISAVESIQIIHG